jgi:hypothetical protein
LLLQHGAARWEEEGMHRLALRIVAVVVALATAQSMGGCQNDKNTKIIDGRIRVSADLPTTWDIAPIVCGAKDPTAPGGLKEFEGCLGFSLGLRPEGGKVDEFIRLFAVPQSKVADYDARKWDTYAAKSVDAGEFAVYTSTRYPTDPDVQRVMKSLKYEK